MSFSGRSFPPIAVACRPVACAGCFYSSREGEVVPFINGVSILQYASLKDWMSAVELQMTVSLADNVSRALRTLEQFDLAEVTTAAPSGSDPLENPFVKWIKDFPLQALLLAMNIRWTKKCEAALSSDDPHQATNSEQTEHPLEASALKDCVALLGFLADRVVQDVGPLIRNRIVHMITEVVHQRDVCRYAYAQWLGDTAVTSSTLLFFRRSCQVLLLLPLFMARRSRLYLTFYSDCCYEWLVTAFQVFSEE